MMISSKVKNYSLEMVEGALSDRTWFEARLPARRKFFFVDERILEIYREPLTAFVGRDFCLPIVATERNKSYESLTAFYRALMEADFKRNDVLVTMGGGILQDISGFIASTIYRGVPWVFFPTTLLAQADSCIGSKTSINFGDFKNLIGTFYPPDYVFLDTGFCDSLRPEDVNSGVGEIIKFHLLSTEEKVEFLKKFLKCPDLRKSEYFRDAVLSTLEIKKSYFEGDEFDTGRRNLLNYGHCFGHALESATDFAVSHGEAVTVGMGFANLLSLKRGLLKKNRYHEFEQILRPHYPQFNFSEVTAGDILNYLKRDKKRVGKDLTMILARDIGNHSKCDDIKEKEIIETFIEFEKRYPSFSGNR